MNETKTCKICGRELEINQFSSHPKSADGHTSVCKECMHKLQSEGHKKRKDDKVKSLEEEVQKARSLRLMDFTPRELMKNLADRGYDGEIVYTEVHRIKLSQL